MFIKYFISLIFLHYSLMSVACTTMSPNGARLQYDRVAVYVVANSTCTDAGVDGEQLLRLTQSAIDQFWNKISSSRLRFFLAGYWNQDVVRFETGELCVPGVNCTNSTVPITDHVIISCNDNTDNFSATTYAKTSIVIESDFITGANVLLNNTSGSVFGNLSEKQKLWVIAHELGHAAGLGHSKSAANLMYFTLTPDRVALGEEDYWGMTYLYPENHDGCGLIGGTTQDQNNSSDNKYNSLAQLQNFLFQLLIGFWIFIAIIIIQKVFLKRFKLII